MHPANAVFQLLNLFVLHLSLLLDMENFPLQIVEIVEASSQFFLQISLVFLDTHEVFFVIFLKFFNLLLFLPDLIFTINLDLSESFLELSLIDLRTPSLLQEFLGKRLNADIFLK